MTQYGSLQDTLNTMSVKVLRPIQIFNSTGQYSYVVRHCGRRNKEERKKEGTKRKKVGDLFINSRRMLYGFGYNLFVLW